MRKFFFVSQGVIWVFEYLIRPLGSPPAANEFTCHKAESFMCVFQLLTLHLIGGGIPVQELCGRQNP